MSMPQKFQQVVNPSPVVRCDQGVHVKGDHCDPGVLDWVGHVSLEVHFQQLQVRVQIRVRDQDLNSVAQRMEAFLLETQMGVLLVDHSGVQKVALSWGCGPAVRERGALGVVVRGRVVHEAFHPHPHLLHRRYPEEPCHRKACDYLSN